MVLISTEFISNMKSTELMCFSFHILDKANLLNITLQGNDVFANELFKEMK